MSESVMLADLVYKNETIIQVALNNARFENIHWIDNRDTDTQVLLCTKGDEIFVTFRGTEFDNIDDWKTNLDFDFVTLDPWGKVFKGFYDDVRSVEEEIKAYLLKMFMAKPYKVIPGGHSQGAGDGGIFSMMYPDFTNSYLPGMPRICDEAAAHNFGAAHAHKIFRIVNNNDIVTRVPPRIWGYWHFVGDNLYYFMEDGTLEIGASWWTRFLDRLNGRWEDIGEWGTDGLKDHDSGHYVILWDSIL